MRLINTINTINTKNLELERWDANPPPYAILSHRWGADDQEVSYQDYQANNKKDTSGYNKIIRLCELAKMDDIEWAWIDTTCIDKTSSTELSEAVNSMFAWYRNATVCYVFFTASDMDVFNETLPNAERRFIPSMAVDHNKAFDPQVSKEYQNSWFGRGWTLQELLAPTKVVFYHLTAQSDNSFLRLGTRKDLKERLMHATGISEEYLLGRRDIQEASIAQRMSWAARRTTTRAEDLAYCLLGIFDINMSLIYGEGDKAFLRLQETIIDRSSDDTIFAWTSGHGDRRPQGLLARSPNNFGQYPCLRPATKGTFPRPPSRVTGRGVQFHVLLPSQSRLRILLTFLWIKNIRRHLQNLSPEAAPGPRTDVLALQVPLNCACGCSGAVDSNGPGVVVWLQVPCSQTSPIYISNFLNLQWHRTSLHLRRTHDTVESSTHSAIYVRPWNDPQKPTITPRTIAAISSQQRIMLYAVLWASSWLAFCLAYFVTTDAVRMLILYLTGYTLTPLVPLFLGATFIFSLLPSSPLAITLGLFVCVVLLPLPIWVFQFF